MHWVAEALAHLFAAVFPQPDDITWRVLQDHCIEFKNVSLFGVHGCKTTKKAAARRPRLEVRLF